MTKISVTCNVSRSWLSRCRYSTSSKKELKYLFGIDEKTNDKHPDDLIYYSETLSPETSKHWNEFKRLPASQQRAEAKRIKSVLQKVARVPSQKPEDLDRRMLEKMRRRYLRYSDHQEKLQANIDDGGDENDVTDENTELQDRINSLGPSFWQSLSGVNKQKKHETISHVKESSDSQLPKTPEEWDKFLNTRPESDPFLHWLEKPDLNKYSEVSQFSQKSIKNKGTLVNSRVLYWNCFNLKFLPSDFERLGVDTNSELAVCGYEFELRRNRADLNMSQLLGYYLIFESPQSANGYHQLAYGKDISGLRFLPEFVTDDDLVQDITKPEEFPRNQSALIYGIPNSIPPSDVLKILWDYDFIDDDTKAVVRLPKGNVEMGDAGPLLLRFRNTTEPTRLMLEYHQRPFKFIGHKVVVEELD